MNYDADTTEEFLEEYDDIHTGYERDIRMTAKRVRTTKATLKRWLRKLGKSTSRDLTKVTINKHQYLQNPGLWEYARRAETSQNNLESHQRRLNRLMERHEQAVERHRESDDQDGESE